MTVPKDKIIKSNAMKYLYYIIYFFISVFPIITNAQNLDFKDKNYSIEIKSSIHQLESNNIELAKKSLLSVTSKLPTHDEANYWLGIIELKSMPKTDNEEIALRYFEISAKSGNELAIYNIAKIKLFSLNDKNIDKENGQKLADYLLSVDSKYGTELLYNIYLKGGNRPFNVQKAMFNAIELGKKGNYNSAIDIFSKKIFGDSIYISEVEKISWLNHLKLSKLNIFPENEINKKIEEIRKNTPNKNFIDLDINTLIINGEKYLIERRQSIGEIEPRDLINEGWRQFTGARGTVNEPLAQYLTEEGLRIAIRSKDSVAINTARNNLGVILSGAVNKYIRNLRLGTVHLYDAIDTEWAPNNLIWNNYQRSISLNEKEIALLKERFFQQNNKKHITETMQIIPIQYTNNPVKIKDLMVEEYNKSYSKEIAAEIADYIEDNNDILKLEEALIWIKKSLDEGDSLESNERYKRINLILKNAYVKDTPDLSNSISFLFELDNNSRGTQNIANSLINLYSNNNSLSTSKINLNYSNNLTTKNKVHALVIGNSNYKSKILKNAVNDSETIAKKLRSYGFEVTHLKNINRRDFNKGLIDFAQKAQGAEVTLFFFAGHGVQMGGLNYILPIDIDLDDSEEIVTYEGININDIVRRSMPGKTKLIFLDACRSSPFKTSNTRGSSDGLAPVNAPRGTLISFATRDGSVAFDSVGGNNSPYSISLAKNLDANEDISIVLRQVRDEVMLLTKNKQEPWEYGALSGGKIIISKLNN